jgi:hypothetical protein
MEGPYIGYHNSHTQLIPTLPRYKQKTMDVGLCHHGMARSQVADGGTASYMVGSCE